MLRPLKKDGRRKTRRKRQNGNNRTLEEEEEDRKSVGRTGIGGHRKAKNPQLKREDPRSEVLEENYKRGKHEQGIKTGTKENVK